MWSGLHKFCDLSRKKRKFLFILSLIHLNLFFFPPFSLIAFQYHHFYLPSFLSTLKHFPPHILSLLYLYPIPAFLPHSIHIPFICTSYCHSSPDFITVLEAGLHFPQKEVHVFQYSSDDVLGFCPGMK